MVAMWRTALFDLSQILHNLIWGEVAHFPNDYIYAIVWALWDTRINEPASIVLIKDFKLKSILLEWLASVFHPPLPQALYREQFCFYVGMVCVYIT